MAIPNKLKRYGYHVVIAIDQLFNALTGKRWRVLYRVINALFFDVKHCKASYESELSGKQHDERFSEVYHARN